MTSLERLNSDGEWFGDMTLENAEAIADRLRKMLTGRRFTFVSVNSGFSETSIPDVRNGQMLDGHVDSKGIGTGENVSFSMLADDHAHIVVCDTYGVWGLSVTARKYEERYHQPYVKFARRTRYCGESMAVIHRNGDGDILRWVVVVEHPADEEE